MNALEFRNIIDGSAGVMYRVALALTGCEADAADAVQDACLRLWEKRAKLAESANPSGYCVGAARNAALDILRARHPAVGPEQIPEIASDADTATACESTEQCRIRLHIRGHIRPGKKLPELGFLSLRAFTTII